MANGQCGGAGEHYVMHVALMTRLDEGLQTNHVELGAQLLGRGISCTSSGCGQCRGAEGPSPCELAKGAGGSDM